MLCSDLIDRLAEQHPDLSLRDVTSVADAFFGEITNALVRGERFEIRGFGAFSTVKRGPERVGSREPGRSCCHRKARSPRSRLGRCCATG